MLAARALAKQMNAISLNVDGETRQGALYRSLRADELDKPFAVTNNGDGNVQAVVSVSGAPLTPEPAAEARLQDRAQLSHARRQPPPIRATPSRTSASSWC